MYPRNTLSLRGLTPPENIQPGTHRAEMVGAIMLGVSTGIQLTLTGMTFWGPSTVGQIDNQLTVRALRWFQPEHDIPIYLLGCALTLLLMIAFTWILNRRLRALTPAIAQSPMIGYGGFQMLVALGGIVLHLLLLSYVRGLIKAGAEVPAAALLGLAGVSLVSLACGVFPLRASMDGGIRWLFGREWKRSLLNDSTGTIKSKVDKGKRDNRRYKVSILDIALPVLIIAVVYTPDCRQLAGMFLLGDQLHHLDFFVMGPAVAYSHGGALGTQIYSQYGVGWPMLLSALEPVVPFSYGGFIHVGVLYGCLYYVGVYLFLRLLMRRAIWATIGITLAIYLQLFQGISVGEVLWKYPSSTILRSPVDIWFFVTVLLHVRSRQRLWAMIAAFLVGVAILFETDTGFYLAATFCFYLIFFGGITWTGDEPIERRTYSMLLACSSVTAGVLLIGLGVASRWTILNKDFWAGWLEALVIYGTGMSMLPFATEPSSLSMVFFALVISTYLGAAGFLIVRRLSGIQSTDRYVLLGCLGVYGLLTQLIFVGRSHPFNIYHASIPFSLTVVILFASMHSFLSSYYGRFGLSKIDWRRVVRSRNALPFSTFVILVILFVQSPTFLSYPSFLMTLAKGSPAKGLCLFTDSEDVCGLPIEAQGFIRQFEAVTKRIKKLSSSGKTVAILDDADTMVYLAAGVPPWPRYSPLFPSLITKKQLEGVKYQLMHKPPDYVFIFANEEHARYFEEVDIWQEFRKSIEEGFLLVENVGPFEVWSVKM